MNFALQIFIFILPLFSMISGLSVAPIAAGFFIINLMGNFRQINFAMIKSNKAILFFFIWCLVSCLWSPDTIQSLKSLIIVFSIFVMFSLSMDKKLYKKSEIFTLPLILGCIAAIIIFFYEYRTSGELVKYISSFVKTGEQKTFYLYILDRGCSVISVLSWLVIYIILKKKYYFSAFFYALIVFYVLNISDSLASYVAFIIAGLVFGLSIASKMRFSVVIIFCIATSSILIPAASYIIYPKEVAESYDQITISGKHRLFIYNFVANKIIENPFVGSGFASSPVIPINEDEDYIFYKQYKWHPLPLHPHNSILQVLLETGVLGLIIFVYLNISLVNRIYTNYKAHKNILYSAAANACFVNYFVIGLISYSVWQSWWISLSAVTILLFALYSNIKE
jgi:O-antigen ligase